MLALTAPLAGCIEEVTCTLTHVPEGQYGEPGRTHGINWGSFPTPYMRFNSFGGHTPRDGSTGYFEIRDNGFLVVTLQDTMIRDTATAIPKRWTSGHHWELVMTDDDRGKLYRWIVDIGRVPSAETARARKGDFTPVPRDSDTTSVWECSGNW